jgi:iron complex outermembrane receptor protein
VLYGQAEPGGLVNVVTKKPQESAAYAANEQIGSYGFYRTTLDATGPIDTGKSILYRFILDDENAGSFRDFVYTHRLSLFPSLTWKLSNTDRVTAEFKYSTGTEVSDNGIPFLPDGTPSNVPISRNYAEPGANAGPIDQYAIKITGLHAFSEAWKLRVVYKSEYIDNPVPNFHIYAGDADASGNLQRFGFATNIFNHWTHQGVADLTGTFDLFGMKHTALVGADFYHLDGNYDANFFSLPSINIYRPVYGQPYSLPPSSTDFFVGELENAFGAYAQDQVDLPGHVHLLAGFRYDNVVASDSGYGNAASKVHDHPSPKPRFGILWQAAPQLSVYASYTENYGATALGGLTLNGTVLPPESAQQYEFGVKTEWLQQRLSATASVYQLTKENVPTADPANPAFTIAVGRARSRGAEFEVAGKITAGWQIIAGYSYIDSITTQDHNTPSLAGLRFPGVPYNSGSLWTTYELRTGKLRGLKLGLGTVARGSEVAFESPTGTGYLADRIPSFAVINAMAAYTLQFGRAKVDAQINVNNLLDKAYYSAVNPSQATPGAPLSAMGLLRIHL